MMARKHRFRTLRNMLIAVLLLTAAWWRMGCPMPTRTMEFHHNEEIYLIDRSRIVFSCESEGERELGDPVMLVGVSRNTVQTYSDTHPFNIWPKNSKGATLVALPSELEYKPNLIVGLVAVEPPTLAETARLTIALTKEGEPVRTVSGEKRGDVFLFRLEIPGDLELNGLFHTTDLPPYMLEFYGADGTLLDIVTNTGERGETA